MVHYISNQDKFENGKIYIPGEGFHTDHSNDIEPPKATFSKEIPSFGGDHVCNVTIIRRSSNDLQIK